MKSMPAHRASLSRTAEEQMLTRWDSFIIKSAQRRAYKISRPSCAEDLAQEARVQLLRATRDGCLGLANESYVRTLIRNAVCNAARGEERLNRACGAEPINVLPSPRGIPVEDGLRLGAWLARLGARDAKIVRMMVAGYSQREIASEFGVTRGRVSQLQLQILATRG